MPWHPQLNHNASVSCSFPVTDRDVVHKFSTFVATTEGDEKGN
jgi:hypothetical protein